MRLVENLPEGRRHSGFIPSLFLLVIGRLMARTEGAMLVQRIRTGSVTTNNNFNLPQSGKRPAQPWTAYI